VEACARLKGGRLPKDKLKTQLQRIALKRTGGTRTDEILGRNSGPEGLPHSIIVTPEGPEGEAPERPGQPTEGTPPEAIGSETPEPAPTARRKGKAKPPKAARSGHRKPAGRPSKKGKPNPKRRKR
jgi:DNA topoisomerase-6 subunit B